MKPNLLDHMKVAAPCHEDWNAMRGNDEVRFCSHCAKDVHNLSQMTRAEAETLIRKSNGRLCVRYVRRADASVVTLPPQSSSKRFNDSSSSARASRLAAGAFTAALAVTSPLAAQTSSSPAPPTVNVEAAVNQIAKPQIGTGSAMIAGTLYDMNDAVVPGAEITLTDISGAIRTTVTDENGTYRVENLPSGTYKLEMFSPGFLMFRDENLSLSERQVERYDVTLETGGADEIVGDLAISISLAEAFVYHKAERATPNVYASEVEDPLLESFNTIATGELEEVEALIKSGFDVNTRWVGNTTPLMLALDYKIAKYLIQHGAEVDARDDYSETALMKARSVDVIEVLINAGAKVNARDSFGVTPLMYAMLNHDEKPAQVLIAAGADVNARDKDSRSALMFACLEGRTETIKVLLDAKAEINARDVNGKTALRFAIENNQEEAVKLLKAAGAVE